MEGQMGRREADMEMDRLTGETRRETGILGDRQGDEETDKKTGRHTGRREIDGETERQTRILEMGTQTGD